MTTSGAEIYLYSSTAALVV